ncbi:MAG: hypothetical protein VW378_03565 [bacterium]
MKLVDDASLRRGESGPSGSASGRTPRSRIQAQDAPQAQVAFQARFPGQRQVSRSIGTPATFVPNTQRSATAAPSEPAVRNSHQRLQRTRDDASQAQATRQFEEQALPVTRRRATTKGSLPHTQTKQIGAYSHVAAAHQPRARQHFYPRRNSEEQPLGQGSMDERFALQQGPTADVERVTFGHTASGAPSSRQKPARTQSRPSSSQSGGGGFASASRVIDSSSRKTRSQDSQLQWRSLSPAARLSSNYDQPIHGGDGEQLGQSYMDGGIYQQQDPTDRNQFSRSLSQPESGVSASASRGSHLATGPVRSQAPRLQREDLSPAERAPLTDQQSIDGGDGSVQPATLTDSAPSGTNPVLPTIIHGRERPRNRDKMNWWKRIKRGWKVTAPFTAICEGIVITVGVVGSSPPLLIIGVGLAVVCLVAGGSLLHSKIQDDRRSKQLKHMLRATSNKKKPDNLSCKFNADKNPAIVTLNLKNIKEQRHISTDEKTFTTRIATSNQDDAFYISVFDSNDDAQDNLALCDDQARPLVKNSTTFVFGNDKEYCYSGHESSGFFKRPPEHSWTFSYKDDDGKEKQMRIRKQYSALDGGYKWMCNLDTRKKEEAELDLSAEHDYSFSSDIRILAKFLDCQASS